MDDRELSQLIQTAWDALTPEAQEPYRAAWVEDCKLYIAEKALFHRQMKSWRRNQQSDDDDDDDENEVSNNAHADDDDDGMDVEREQFE